MGINLDREKTNLIVGIMIVAVILLIGLLVAIIITDQNNQRVSTYGVDSIIELTDNQKVEINDRILNDYVTQFLISQQFKIDTYATQNTVDVYAKPSVNECSNAQISDKTILNTVTVYMIQNGQISKSEEADENQYIINVDEAQSVAENLFGRQIELTKIDNNVKNGQIEININPEIKLVPYKIRQLKYNKVLGQYTAIFDYIKYDKESYSANKIEYDDSDIIATYTLVVSEKRENEGNNEYIYISLGC